MSVSAYPDEKSRSAHEEIDHSAVFSHKAEISDYKQDAIEAENDEHNMTVLQTVRAYPMASFWAFVMSCTIVSCIYSLVAMNNIKLT